MRDKVESLVYIRLGRLGDVCDFVYFQEVEDVISHWPQLLVMDLRGNPVCRERKYRDRLISVCNGLGKILLIFLISGHRNLIYFFDFPITLLNETYLFL